MSAPADLEGLPWPDGEPGPLRSCASRLRGLAGGFDGAGTRLGGAVAPAWSGFAATSYSGTLGHAQTAVSHLGGSLDTAAGALGHLADVIEHAQHAVRVAAAKLHDARAGRRPRAAHRAGRTRRCGPRPHRRGARPGPHAGRSAVDAGRRGRAPRAGHRDHAPAASSRMRRGSSAGRTRRPTTPSSASRRPTPTARAPCEGTGMAGGPTLGGAATAAGAQSVWDFVYDVAGKPLNPWDPGYTPGESAGSGAATPPACCSAPRSGPSRYASQNWMRYEPGYWAREPRWVAPYTRSTPSGGTTQVSGYMRKGSWASAQEVPDLAERAKWASRAETVRQVRHRGGVRHRGRRPVLRRFGQGLHDLRADRPHHRPDSDGRHRLGARRLGRRGGRRRRSAR